MTKAEQFDKARRLALLKGDFSLVDEIYHPDAQVFDHRIGMEVRLDMKKTLDLSYGVKIGPSRVIYENDDFLCIHRYLYHESRKRFWSIMTAVNYQDEKVIRHDTSVEEPDYDPSENQNWNWEDFE